MKKVKISEAQFNNVYNKIYTEGKKATIHHKAAAGTTDQEYFQDDTYQDNDKRISVQKYIDVNNVGKLKGNQTILQKVDGEEVTFMKASRKKAGYFITYKESSGEVKSGSALNLFINP